MKTNILTGHTSRETAYEVKDYPYGFRLRTSIFYWIESKAGKGDRFCTYTINPKNGKANAVKCSTYNTFMYMFLDENGHVKHGCIDAYNLEKFVDQFHFIINDIGFTWVTSVQEQNLRDNYRAHILGNFPYWLAKYTEETKPQVKEWLKETISHIKNCPFTSLVEHPERPIEDNPTGEIKMIVTEIEPKKEETSQHEITVEKVQNTINKVVPSLVANVTKYNGFGGEYLKILIGAKSENGSQVQPVGLMLSLKDLDLHPQSYGGEGGQVIYREPNLNDPKERFLAMKSVRIPFRTPSANEKDVLRAIELYAINYKKVLLENKDVLKCRELINFDQLKTA